ncbi:hypothetical protein [Citrobacter sp. FP75]|uniref:hypothetical protein n=1 Tax=Citrobacter sp. FP75 TaxID=1852949 RepID=UPI001BC980AE|nr:hypothetical protein [Citrobacter sp. FP75]
MQDYIIFGHGYEGEVREYDDNLDVIRVVSKPVLIKAGDPTPASAVLRTFDLQVVVMSCLGKFYNVAAESLPTEDELKIAIMQENPSPVPQR